MFGDQHAGIKSTNDEPRDRQRPALALGRGACLDTHDILLVVLAEGHRVGFLSVKGDAAIALRSAVAMMTAALLAASVGVTLVAPVALATVGPCGTNGVPSGPVSGVSTCTYSSTTPDIFTIPATVNKVSVVAIGGKGGNGFGHGLNPLESNGGYGAVVTANNVAVTGGTSLAIQVAGNGGSGVGRTGGAGGTGGGGAGGSGTSTPSSTGGAGGGGGASSVYASSTALVVSAGGGGDMDAWRASASAFSCSFAFAMSA